LPLKFTDPFFGKLAFKTGAILSFKPPVMLPRLAQLDMITKNSKQNNFKIDFGIRLFFKAQNNNYI
jgi:hypothetical protein